MVIDVYFHMGTQMAGRAGRRGIDTVGYIFHLNNFFINRNHIDVIITDKC